MARSIGLLLLWAAMTEAAMPLPFTQEWRLTSPAENGTQVMILQNLLANCHFAVPITSSYDQATAFAVQKFQTGSYHCDVVFVALVTCGPLLAAYQLSASGVLDESTASLVLQHCLADGYKDDGQPANALGYKYKVSFRFPKILDCIRLPDRSSLHSAKLVVPLMIACRSMFQFIATGALKALQFCMQETAQHCTTSLFVHMVIASTIHRIGQISITLARG